MQQAIDKGVVNGHVDMERILRLCVIATVFITVASLAMWAAIIRLAVRAEEALYGLRVQVFDHILAMDLADHEEERRGSLVARVTSDIETLSQFFSWGGLAWLLDGTMIIVTAAVMLIYDWKLALIALFAAAPLVFLLRIVQRHLVHAYSQVRERNAELLTSVSELVTGAAVIRAYRIGRRTSAETKGAIDRHRESSIRAGTIAAFLFPSGEVFSVLTIAAVLVAGTALGPASGLTTGAMVGFIFLCYRFLEPVAEFTEILDQTQTAVAGWRRVLGILERPITITDPDDGRELPRSAPSIALDHVTFRYRPRPGQDDADNKPAFRDVSFSIEPGTAVAVVGATGSGKTTLARLLTRLADPELGAVRIAGIDLREVSMASLRRSLVMVPQEPFLYDTSIAENVRFGRPGADDDDVHLAFVELGLEEWVAGLGEGLATKVGERGDALSAGERQLVALARAYVANPPCLVLDEATSSVDALTETAPGPGAGQPRPGPDVGHDRPPPVDGVAGPAHPRVRPRATGRAGDARRPPGCRRCVLRAVRQLARRHHGRRGARGPARLTVRSCRLGAQAVLLHQRAASSPTARRTAATPMARAARPCGPGVASPMRTTAKVVRPPMATTAPSCPSRRPTERRVSGTTLRSSAAQLAASVAVRKSTTISGARSRFADGSSATAARIASTAAAGAPISGQRSTPRSCSASAPAPRSRTSRAALPELVAARATSSALAASAVERDTPTQPGLGGRSVARRSPHHRERAIDGGESRARSVSAAARVLSARQQLVAIPPAPRSPTRRSSSKAQKRRAASSSGSSGRRSEVSTMSAATGRPRRRRSTSASTVRSVWSGVTAITAAPAGRSRNGSQAKDRLAEVDGRALRSLSKSA